MPDRGMSSCVIFTAVRAHGSGWRFLLVLAGGFVEALVSGRSRVIGHVTLEEECLD